MKVSVIIPVYNTGEKLRRCLDSIIAQEFRDFECIIIDDGSTDDSPAIIDEYAARDVRFKAVHKTNGGTPNLTRGQPPCEVATNSAEQGTITRSDEPTGTAFQHKPYPHART